MSSRNMARRTAAGTLALAVCIGGGSIALAGSANAGDRRLDATVVAQTATPISDGLPALVLASGSDGHLVDALGAAPLASLLGAPILLTPSTGDLDSRVSTYLSARESTDGAVQTVYVIGGAAAVPEQAASTLVRQGYQVVRLGGATRYDTARAVAQAHDAAMAEVDAN